MGLLSIELYPTDPFRYITMPPATVLHAGDHIIVSTPEGVEEAAQVKRVLESLEPDQLGDEYRADYASDITMLRIATENDRQRIDANEKLVEHAIADCADLVEQHHLDMRLVTAHFSFDGRQVMFVFTAESRVDFRALVKDLARHFKKRVRLKQIGPRDRARYIGQKFGAYGRCGRPLCCATFLRELDSVTMDMVRVQNLENKGATKLSGVCGKLMNCLSYEVPMYQSLRQELPEIGTKVRTSQGIGIVSSFDILSQILTVNHEETGHEQVHLKDIEIVKA